MTCFLAVLGLIAWNEANMPVASIATCQAQTYSTRLLQNEAQVESIIKSMTLEEKIEMLHGKNMFSSAGVPRLGIADVEYADGPFGIREEMEPHSWNSAHLTTDSPLTFSAFRQVDEPMNI